MSERIPVLIVGGGYAGLSAAALLAWRNVPVILVERHPSTSIQPKAFGVSPRALELLRPIPGLEQELGEIWQGIGDGMRIAISSSLSDPNPQMIMNDESEALAFLADLSPVGQVGAPQAEVERLLRAKAEELGADLRFSTELVALQQDDEGVTAVIRTAGGSESTVRADYAIAADGYRSPLRAQLGIPTSGKGDLTHMCSILFDADLSGLVRDREVTLWYVQNEALTGVIITGTGVGAHGIGINYDPSKGESEADFTEERCVELIRIGTGLPDLEVEVLDRTAFVLAHSLAERYREGRVFLAGDSAHTMPPTGGQGGSTALQDGCDLAWRLWLVITGQAGEEFLDTYDAERRPIGTLTADAQLANLGLRMPPAMRVDYPEPLKDPYAALLGYRYHSSAIINEPGDDGSLLEEDRIPLGRPGSRAPHVVLDWDDAFISTHDLFGEGFVLLAGPYGHAWVEAARTVSDRLRVRLAPHRISDDLHDADGVWQSKYGVGPGGAVLVRPDGFMAWRSPEPDPAPAVTLETVLRQVLSR